ncbi:MAG: hypothetical protein WC708_15530 [Lentisphaeria bacterium]
MNALGEWIREKLLRLVASLTMVGAGAYASSTSQGVSGISLVGALLTAIGGALLGDTIAPEDRTRRQVVARLAAINRHLGSSVNQIISIIKRTIEGNTPAQESLNLVAEVVPVLGGLITDIAELSGQKFDPTSHNETIASLGNLITRMEEYEDKAISDPKGRELFREDLEKLKSIYTRIQDGVHSFSREFVNCPYCGTRTECLIGLQGAASASPRCDKCREMFHAHRTKDGVVISRPMGKRPVTCPVCRNPIPVKLPSDGTLVERYCIKCGRKMTIDSQGQITKSEDRHLCFSSGSADDHAEGLLVCPDHGEKARLLTEDNDCRYAICKSGDHLIVYKKPEEMV